jgi:hypothetical protein
MKDNSIVYGILGLGVGFVFAKIMAEKEKEAIIMRAKQQCETGQGINVPELVGDLTDAWDFIRNR